MFKKMLRTHIHFKIHPFLRYKKPSTPWYNNRKTYEKQRSLWTLQIGLLGAIFGLCYLTVPLYRLFCQHMGLEGDLKQKDYSSLNAKKINKDKKIKIIFEAETSPELHWDFEPVQKEILVHPGETALMFYRAYNHQSVPVIGMAIYSIYPELATNYFSKIQCFCFNQQMLNSHEELDMPLYFYIEPEFQDDPNVQNVETIRVAYKFFPCKKQDLAKLVYEQNLNEIKQKIFIHERRKERFLKEGLDTKPILNELENLNKTLQRMIKNKNLVHDEID